MAEPIIRMGEEKDLDGMALIEQASFAAPWSREALRADLCFNALSYYVVAELEGRVAGYIGCWYVGGECQINNVAVSPGYRRRHIGSLMLATVIDTFTRAGAELFTLEVRSGNLPAICLYRSFGFAEDGIRPGYYRDNGEDAILMSRRAGAGAGETEEK